MAAAPVGFADVPASPRAAEPIGMTGGSLVGEEKQPQVEDREARNRGFVIKIRSMHTALDDLAREFPAFSSFAKRAQDALKEGMLKALAQTQPEESSRVPRVLG